MAAHVLSAIALRSFRKQEPTPATLTPQHDREQEQREEAASGTFPHAPPEAITNTTTSVPQSSPSDQQHKQASATTWQPMADPATDNQHQHGNNTCTNVHLAFYQKYFYRMVNTEPEKQNGKGTRRFSYRSLGCLIVLLIILLLLLGIIGAVVGIKLSRSEKPYEKTPNNTSPVRAVLNDNFPDPTLWLEGDTWYAYGTNNAAGILQRPKNASNYDYGVSNIQVASSTNFIDWELLNSIHDPLPTTGAWAVQGHDNRTSPPIPRANVWAPSVTRQPTGRRDYIMYYAAARNKLAEPKEDERVPAGANEYALLPKHPSPHCVGAATATSPLGPFSPLPEPIACQISQGGAIDPAAFTDQDNTPYLLYKIDGNNIGHGGECGNTADPRIPTPIMLQKLSSDGLAADGEAIEILDRTSADGPLVEAPALIRSEDGVYFLFFSSGCTRAPSYDLKYATAEDITGPYTRADRALLQTGDWGLHAPGSVGLLPDGEGKWNAVFHARVAVLQGRVRALFAGKVELKRHEAKFVKEE